MCDICMAKGLYNLGISEHVQYMHGIGARNPTLANIGGGKQVRYMHNTKIYPTPVQANIYIICMAKTFSKLLAEGRHIQFMHNKNI